MNGFCYLIVVLSDQYQSFGFLGGFSFCRPDSQAININSFGQLVAEIILSVPFKWGVPESFTYLIGIQGFNEFAGYRKYLNLNSHAGAGLVVFKHKLRSRGEWIRVVEYMIQGEAGGGTYHKLRGGFR